MLKEEESKVAGSMSRCASCGVTEGDGVKLKNCTACYLVKYCGVKCQKQHRPKHKRACKQRAAELHDEILFRQPLGNHFGDCPICFLPQSNVSEKCIITTCCGKLICNGCSYANELREHKDKLDHKCAFCRQPIAKSGKEADKRTKEKAAEMKDPETMHKQGGELLDKGDYQAAMLYLSKAAELGNAQSHYKVGLMYHQGLGVDKNKAKAVHHYEKAAIAGHPFARHNLAALECDNGRHERAVKHWIIATKLGFDPSLECLKYMSKKGLVSKDDFDAALCGHKAAVDATKSPQRDEAEASGLY